MSDESPTAEPESLETIQARHRKEQRDLVSRITQKKKQANKKTRKGVNEECDRLERELKERQEQELAPLNGDVTPQQPETQDKDSEDEDGVTENLKHLQINNTPPQSQSSSTNGDPDSTAKPKKRNRAKDRLARRAADQATAIREAEQEAANAPNPREIERSAMATQLERYNLTLHEIRADGHCLYAAVADQLQTRELGLQPKIDAKIAGQDEKMPAYKTVRHAAAGWIEAHEEDFSGFTEDPLPEHIRKIRETGEWGGHLELQALAKAYGVRICVLHSDGQVDKFEGDGKDMEEVWLGYYKHSHGLGEHYNSLRKIG